MRQRVRSVMRTCIDKLETHMPEQKTITVYTYDELSFKAKEVARDEHRDVNVDHPHWFDSTEDTIKELGKLAGISIDGVLFTGFSSQGDGACFEGTYAFKPDALEAVTKEMPQEKQLHAAVADIVAAQARASNRLSATVVHRGRYYHDGSADIEVDADVTDVDPSDTSIDDTDDTAATELKEALRAFMRWSYRLLEREHQWLTSDEAVVETIEANEYRFTADGKRYAY
jgi:hypothetical protein